MTQIPAALLATALISLATSALVMHFANWRDDTTITSESYRLPAFYGYLVSAIGLLLFWGLQYEALQKGVSISAGREVLVGLLILALPLAIAAYCFDFCITVERERLLIRRWRRSREIPFKDITDTALWGLRTRYSATLTLYLRDGERLRFDGPFGDLERLNAMIRVRMAGPSRGQWASAEKRKDTNRMVMMIAIGVILLLLMLATFRVLDWIQH